MNRINVENIEFMPGMVIEDSYGNPAVVLCVNAERIPTVIMQTAGSDHGRHASPPMYLKLIHDESRAERAREVAREYWRQGKRWATYIPPKRGDQS